MKICLAQIKPIKGDVIENTAIHLKSIEYAIKQRADLIAFPELSLTGYEPRLAKELAFQKEDKRIEVFQSIADQHAIHLLIGIPLLFEEGIQICQLIITPNQSKKYYSKQILHEDEKPFFRAGNTKEILEIKGQNIGLGICYESLQYSHLKACLQEDIQLYLACVAKPQRALDKAFVHYQKSAYTHNINVAMVNAIGSSDNFISAGQSSVWNKRGDLLLQGSHEHEEHIVFQI